MLSEQKYLIGKALFNRKTINPANEQLRELGVKVEDDEVIEQVWFDYGILKEAILRFRDHGELEGRTLITLDDGSEVVFSLPFSDVVSCLNPVNTFPYRLGTGS